MMKIYRLFLLILIILSSCGSVCAERVHSRPHNFQTHIDINDKCVYQHVYIQKGKNLKVKAELWAEKTIFGHDEPLAHENLIWFVTNINDDYKLMSTDMRSTDMFGNSYQTFKTGELEKGDYAIAVNYLGGQSDILDCR